MFLFHLPLIYAGYCIGILSWDGALSAPPPKYVLENCEIKNYNFLFIIWKFRQNVAKRDLSHQHLFRNTDFNRSFISEDTQKISTSS